MKNRIFYALAAAAAMGLVGSASADTIGNVTPDVIFGSGNTNGSFTINRTAGVEIGLRGKLRHNSANSEQPANIYNSTGTVDGFGNVVGTSTYNFDARQVPGQSLGTGEWSFEWSINTNWDGSSGLNLNDLQYTLGLDSDPSQGTNFFPQFDPINGFNPHPDVMAIQWDHAIGDNGTGNGGGASISNSVDDVAGYASAIDSHNVAQNSWKAVWYFPGFNPTIDGTYDIFLNAYTDRNDLNTLVAGTSIQIIVGNGGAAVVPIPGAAGLGLLGMGIVGYMRRRKNAVA